MPANVDSLLTFCASVESNANQYFIGDLERILAEYVSKNDVEYNPGGDSTEEKRHAYAIVSRILLCAMKSRLLDDRKSSLEGNYGISFSLSYEFFKFQYMKNYIEETVDLLEAADAKGCFAEGEMWDKVTRFNLYNSYLIECDLPALVSMEKGLLEELSHVKRKQEEVLALAQSYKVRVVEDHCT